ncbi:ABC transporter ATP-binding protein [Paracoccus sp. J39]|uniref:ABC transporter ATP-binding protein n=1 Tax=Paracoccus sp. J39 TaxID=935848 RepID=UPI00048EFAA2|nr:ABC transporter ATP-binding protein [Paracoccus sp. J39]
MSNQTDTLLSAKGLTKHFGGLVAVSNFDIEIGRGQIVGLIGPNGAGKSTTFNLLSGFYKPTSGELYFEGRNCTGASMMTISRLGLVRTFQHGSLCRSLSVADNILIGTMHALAGLHRRERARSVAEIAGILGLTPYLGATAGTLPHGIQRLVSIAIAFAAKPKLLCLDEPLTGLNQTEVTSTLEVFDLLRREHGCTILLVEHNMKAVMSACDKIVVLHHGQHLATGTPAEIQRNEAVIEAYLGKRHEH